MLSYEDDNLALCHGDALDILRQLPDNSVDSVVTDPPYGLEFMGKDWDAPWKDERTDTSFQRWCELWAAECLRILKPGGHILTFGGTRTWHRLACAIEDAGFEIRDSIAWLYGSGFPKSLDVSKAIDKAAGAEREVLSATERGSRLVPGADAARTGQAWHSDERPVYVQEVTAPATDDAKRWAGWGTALKPAFEPIVVGRKPLSGTVAATVLEHGTGALNIDGCRVEHSSEADLAKHAARVEAIKRRGGQMANSWKNSSDLAGANDVSLKGRWPSNVVLDESQAAVLDEQKGGVSRFFPIFRYQAKAPKKERPVVDGNMHPTVKPLELMRWLVRLVTPPGGWVLDPFAGSGTTAEAALAEGMRCILIEREAEYLPLIMSRLGVSVDAAE